MDHKPQPYELMDLTEFMHGGPGELRSCARCGLAARVEAAITGYEHDAYDRDLLDHLYPRYLRAFTKRVRQYGGLLPPRAEIIELGSHTGAFLEASEEWGWRPTGLDVGRSTHAFSRARGLRVKRESIEDSRLRPHGSDAIFIWNCFEQLEDPSAVLARAHELLRPFGVLVVRIPSLDFYERLRGLIPESARALRQLAYNNLLGFPYLHGYRPATLASFLRRHGFAPIAGVNSTLLTPPFADLPRPVKREIGSVFRGVHAGKPMNPELLSGPWIEIACRCFV